MCGIAGIIGLSEDKHRINEMLEIQSHRGPDASGCYEDPSFCQLGHNRLSIIDLSEEGNQPMIDQTGRYVIVFNGEIYNYLELKSQLSDYDFLSKTDTEVLLASYLKWGPNCLDRFVGMFAFGIWDNQEKILFAARDRFGIKPFYYTFSGNEFCFASEIKTLWKVGTRKEMNLSVWASYYASASFGLPHETFWQGIHQLPAGHQLIYSFQGNLKINRWYGFEQNVKTLVDTPDSQKKEAYIELLRKAVSLRFRSDVPVGFALSGGLDSSVLLAIVDSIFEESKSINAFTFTSGDERYDELPWVKILLQGTDHPMYECRLLVKDVPSLAEQVSSIQDEPYGGFPTLAYSNIFKQARQTGTIVLLDGQGMDEAWAGYDYYVNQSNNLVQGTQSSPVRPECIDRELLKMATPFQYPQPFGDRIQNVQYRDLFYTKIPRALRFNDRVSMMHSTELREPFLDHRLVELSFSYANDFKIKEGKQKWMLREIAMQYLKNELILAPKRPVQTPQREWLSNELVDWADALITSFAKQPWVNVAELRKEWELFRKGNNDNSFYVWQWINSTLLFQGF